MFLFYKVFPQQCIMSNSGFGINTYSQAVITRIENGIITHVSSW